MADRTVGSADSVEVAQAALRELLTEVPGKVRLRVVQEVGAVIREQRQRERERCADACRRRAVLWRNTSASQSSLASAREEARARANEALYLADLLTAGEHLSAPGGGDVADA